MSGACGDRAARPRPARRYIPDDLGAGVRRRRRMSGPGEAPGGWGRRLLWFIGLYLAGLGTITLVAYALRALMGL